MSYQKHKVGQTVLCDRSNKPKLGKVVEVIPRTSSKSTTYIVEDRETGERFEVLASQLIRWEKDEGKI